MGNELKSFLWRMWNTVKYPLLFILSGVAGKIIDDVSDAGTIQVLTSWLYWDGIIVTLLQLVGTVLGVGGMAGIDKVMRIKK